jgi:hypothetical protein
VGKNGKSQRVRNIYFFLGLQLHSEDFLPQPEQTPFSTGLPHFLHGVQPHT